MQSAFVGALFLIVNQRLYLCPDDASDATYRPDLAFAVVLCRREQYTRQDPARSPRGSTHRPWGRGAHTRSSARPSESAVERREPAFGTPTHGAHTGQDPLAASPRSTRYSSPHPKSILQKAWKAPVPAHRHPRSSDRGVESTVPVDHLVWKEFSVNHSFIVYYTLSFQQQKWIKTCFARRCMPCRAASLYAAKRV